MKKPRIKDAENCISLRKMSKQGTLLSSENLEFCHQMYLKYPAWYIKIEEQVFNETVPFGSVAKYKRGKQW